MKEYLVTLAALLVAIGLVCIVNLVILQRIRRRSHKPSHSDKEETRIVGPEYDQKRRRHNGASKHSIRGH